MKTTNVCAVLAMSVAVSGWADAGGSRSPEQLGAHWARVSDVAEIQLIVDELRSGGGSVEGTIRKHVSSNVQQSLVRGGGGKAEVVLKSTGAAADRLPVGETGWSVKVQANAATVDFSSGEQLQLQKERGSWRISGGSLPPDYGAKKSPGGTTIASNDNESGVSVGETFIETPVSKEHSIERLTRQVTQSKIDRQLFGVPEKTASYYSVRYLKTPPFVTATYVQLIIDAEWDRIVYGNMDRWIKTFSVQSPSAIAVDSDGNVFVGEPANKRVLVLKLVGNGDEVSLQYHHQIDNIVNATDLCINDNGTPFDTNDDYLYVADASRNAVYKYTAGANANTLVATYDEFDSPTSIAAGRWNGANESILYVIDKVAKRIRVFDDDGGALFPLREFRGEYSQYFSSMKVDHFGNVFVVDKVNSKVIKFTSALDFLDEEGGDGTFTALGNIDIPFAKIVVDGDRNYWTGFDQLFAIERWDNTSGVQRRALSVKMKNIQFHADADVSAVGNTFLLTDVGDVNIRIFDEHKRLVRTLTSSWMLAGEKNLQWDRRSDEGAQVPAGTYRYEIGASSAYGGEPIFSNTRFYLPLYYHEDCGNPGRVNDAHLVQGSVVAWGTLPSQTANEHASSVQYRFTGLNPAGEYEVAAECAAGDGVQRLQNLTAGGIRLGDTFRVGVEPVASKFFTIPRESYSGGEVTISVNKLGEGSAIVTQLWIKETGVGFQPVPIATIPTKYLLEQNYPNPFNPSTTIRYSVPVDGIVTLKVYNLNGQEVATLVNDPKSAGKYEVTFNARNTAGVTLASGIYFYRITSGSFSETRKMLLVK